MSEDCTTRAAIFRKNWDLMKARHKKMRKLRGLDKDDKKSSDSIYSNQTVKQLVETNKLLTQTLCGVLGKGKSIDG